MSTIARRLRRLEERFRPAVESEKTREVRERLEAARLRSGLPPISAERLAELRGMGTVAILHAARLRAAMAQDEAPVLPKGSAIL